MRKPVWVLAAVAAVAACKRGGESESRGIKGAGVEVSSGIAADLRATPDRQQITFLTDAIKPRIDGVPPQMLLGVLNVLPAGGGKPRRLGTGVTNVPGGHLVSPDSRWALYLEGFNAASHAGTLHVVDLKDPAASPVKLDTEVTYLLPSPDSASVAFVRGGVLKVGPLPSGPFREVAGEVTTGQFSPDSAYLAFKRSQAAAGGLGLVKVAGSEPLRKLGDQVGDYSFSPDSKRITFAVRSQTTPGTFDLFLAAVSDAKPQKVASACSSFAFSPDGKWLARTEGARVVEAVNFVGDLVIGPADGSPGQTVASSVNGTGFNFSPDSTHVAALEKFDFTKGREWGSLVVVPVTGGKPRELGRRVKTFLWSGDSKVVAFQPIEFTKEFGPSANLLVYRQGEEAAKQVLTGVWGYSFDPKSRYLLARNGCTRAGAGAPRACDLQSIELAKPELAAKKIIDAVFSFKTTVDGDRILVTYAEIGPDTFNVAAYDVATAVRKTLDQHILLPALFVGEANDRVAYVVAERSRAGVYVAPVDGAQAARAAQ